MPCAIMTNGMAYFRIVFLSTSMFTQKVVVDCDKWLEIQVICEIEVPTYIGVSIFKTNFL